LEKSFLSLRQPSAVLEDCKIIPRSTNVISALPPPISAINEFDSPRLKLLATAKYDSLASSSPLIISKSIPQVCLISDAISSLFFACLKTAVPTAFTVSVLFNSIIFFI
jgi:hypothetical protein